MASSRAAAIRCRWKPVRSTRFNDRIDIGGPQTPRPVENLVYGYSTICESVPHSARANPHRHPSRHSHPQDLRSARSFKPLRHSPSKSSYAKSTPVSMLKDSPADTGHFRNAHLFRTTRVIRPGPRSHQRLALPADASLAVRLLLDANLKPYLTPIRATPEHKHVPDNSMV